MGEYTALADQTIETIRAVSKSLRKEPEALLADIIKQHFESISSSAETKRPSEQPPTTQAVRSR